MFKTGCKRNCSTSRVGQRVSRACASSDSSCQHVDRLVAIDNPPGLLPTVPTQADGTLISNDVATSTVGHFQLDMANGGGTLGQGQGNSGVTAQGNTELFTNQNFIYDYLQYVDVGGDGGAVALRDTTITQPATLTDPNTVVSKGMFMGQNGLVDWTATTSIAPGTTTAITALKFNSATGKPIGNLQLIDYLDEDINLPSDDLLKTTGTPGQAGFLAYTLDGPERVGLRRAVSISPEPVWSTLRIRAGPPTVTTNCNRRLRDPAPRTPCPVISI